MRRFRLLVYLISMSVFRVAWGATLSGFAPGGFLHTAGPVVRELEPAPGLFLVASRRMTDPHFSQTVIYLVIHNDQGTLGLVVNRPSPIRLSEAVSGIGREEGDDHAIYIGGPVNHDLITMLIRSEQENALMKQVADDVYFSHDRRVLDQLLAEQKPANALRCYMGHAGWTAGQLDKELEHGDWHIIKADPNAIFSSRPGSLWNRLIEKIDPGGLYVGMDAILSG